MVGGGVGGSGFDCWIGFFGERGGAEVEAAEGFGFVGEVGQVVVEGEGAVEGGAVVGYDADEAGEDAEFEF